jgi:hypothetical protein
MGKRRGLWIVLAMVLALVVGVFLTSGPPPATPNPPGTFSFAALGDAPYYAWEEIRYRLVLQALDAHDLGFIIHVGDIFWRPCTDEHYKETLGRFNGLRHPVIYTPGDNEWADCWEQGSGTFAPQERLDRIRQIFFKAPTQSLGRKHVTLVSQGSEFVENVRWKHQGIVFVTVHIVGSRNGTKPFPGRSEADDNAVRRRTEAAAAWLRDTFAEARATGAPAVVIAFHGDPAFEDPISERQAFDPFIVALEEEAERFIKPVLVIHGDGHVYTVDHPLLRRTTGRKIRNLTRLEVPGSPDVGWVRIVVTPGAKSPFAFAKHVVPRWKYW